MRNGSIQHHITSVTAHACIFVAGGDLFPRFISLRHQHLRFNRRWIAICRGVRTGVRGTVNREDEEAVRTHGLHLMVFGVGGPVGTAIPLYDHALN